MTSAATPKLTHGAVYRTRDLARWSANPTRLASRLVRDGDLVRLGHGLYGHPTPGFFGPTLPDDRAVMRAFLSSDAFIFSGPPTWNPLGLGATGTFAVTLVYNTKRSGTFVFGGRTYILRRVAFPRVVTPEWRVVDLLRNADAAGTSLSALGARLRDAVESGRFDVASLLIAAEQFAEYAVAAVVAEAVGARVG